MICTFLGSVKLVRYLIELKCTHQSVTEVLETCVHISLSIRKIVSLTKKPPKTKQVAVQLHDIFLNLWEQSFLGGLFVCLFFVWGFCLFVCLGLFWVGFFRFFLLRKRKKKSHCILKVLGCRSFLQKDTNIVL